MISFHTQNIEFNIKNKRILKNWIKQVIVECKKRVGDLNIIFCSDSDILKINNEFLQHNYYTDIITFDYCEEEIISGDLYISIDSVRINAKDYEQTFENELHRVIIHGILHLCEYDDHNEEDIKLIREAENNALSLLRGLIEIPQR